MAKVIKIEIWGFVDPANPPPGATLFAIGGGEDTWLREHLRHDAESWDKHGPSDVRTTPAKWPAPEFTILR